MKNDSSLNPALWISQSEAAKMRGVSRQAIANLVKKDRFRTLKIGGKTLLHRQDVETYQDKPPGPEPKSKPTPKKSPAKKAAKRAKSNSKQQP
jgi:excisionase family DNA binding protein